MKITNRRSKLRLEDRKGIDYVSTIKVLSVAVIVIVVVFIVCVLLGLFTNFVMEYWRNLILCTLCCIIMLPLGLFLLFVTITESVQKRSTLKDYSIVICVASCLIGMSLMLIKIIIIPYTQDIQIAASHNYSVIEGDITHIKRNTSSNDDDSVSITVDNQSTGAEMTINFKQTLLMNLQKGDHCKIEYLPHSLVGVSIE